MSSRSEPNATSGSGSEDEQKSRRPPVAPHPYNKTWSSQECVIGNRNVAAGAGRRAPIGRKRAPAALMQRPPAPPNFCTASIVLMKLLIFLFLCNLLNLH
ncbi:hypothetical protein EVAR_66073_1 [Eumeta japonica]|uniref:Uncharacterized protein n=1 Tax=Eumeta variegata TaxID=151549 RepID=A0A4C2A0B7_EUMVA|nr:hypothetical protein EVAR_66073_1 [Eumeta japonica]